MAFKFQVSTTTGSEQSYFKKSAMLICLMVCIIHSTTAIPLHLQILTKATRSASMDAQLSVMKMSIDDALTEFITTSMDCTSIEACRVSTTNLQITTLPAFIDFKDTDNWNSIFEQNLNGLQDFNYYLQHFSRASPAGTLSGIAENQFKDVANLLLQFLTHFEAHIKENFCMKVNIIPLSDYPPCPGCVQPKLPSVSLEIVRNYQFMMQFYNFLGDFINMYNTFLFSSFVPESC